MTLFKTQENLWMPVISSIVILISVMIMVGVKKKCGDTPEWFSIFIFLFAAWWIVLGYSVAMGKGNTAMLFGVGASILVIVNMLMYMQ